MQHTRLNGGTGGHDFIGVDALVRFLAEELGHFLDHAGHPGHAADQHDFVDVRDGDAGVFQGGLARLDRPFDQVVAQAFQLGAGQLHHQVQRLARVAVHADEGLVDLGLGRGREFDLGLFGRLFQALQGHFIQGQVNAMLFLELIREVVHEPHVKVFATQERVAVGGFHLEQAVVNFQNRDVERAAAKVVDRDGFGFFLVQPVSQSRSGRFVDDAQDFEARDFAGVFGGLALGVVEIGRDGDDGLRHGFAQIRLSGFLHLLQDDRGDLAGREFLAPGFDPSVAVAAVDHLVGQVFQVFGQHRIIGSAADQTLDGKDGVGGVGHGLALGGLADQTFVFGEGHDGRRGARAFGVFDDSGLATIHDGDAGVGGSQVNADDLGHVRATFS